MAMAEWLRGHLFSGFPWNLYAHVWSTSPALLQTAALGGAWLLSVLTLFWATLPAFLVVRPAAPGRWVLPAVGVATFVGCLAYGHTRLRRPVEFHPDVALRLVQPNIAQADKSNPQKAAENLAVLLELSAREPASGGVTFVVWPETAVAARTLELPGVRRRIAEALSAHPPDTYLLTGVLRHDEPARGLERYFNSLLVLDRTGATIATYDKSRLVPFAERVPLRSLLDLAPYVNRIASLTPGTGPATIAVHAGVPPFSPAICYEIIFPRAVTSATGARPEWIVNVTNDAWFGDSPGPYQHFVHARFRAVEEGLPVVRVANAGISGVVDPFGRIVAMSGLFTRTALATRLPLAAAPTPYALLGDAPVLGLIVLTAIAAAIRRP
jgi:apolipoprotein N-acyltransferase